MSQYYFTDFKEANCINANAKLVKDRVMDIRDGKWGYPEYQDGWNSPADGGVGPLYSLDLDMDTKIASADATMKMLVENYGYPPSDECDLKKFRVPGCPEEPETETEVWVYTPKTLKKKKNRTIFYCMGGALVSREPLVFGLDQIALKYNVILVTVLYRTSLQAEYPAALNDTHAGYQWMIEHAEELRINPNNIVINGTSSGGQMALNLGFRLKRYGFPTPKGIVVYIPQTGVYENGKTGLYSGVWDYINQHDALQQYFGRNTGNSLMGPEALPNYATVEDCIGYPPTFIHTGELDPDRNHSREFYGKLLEARTFAEYHCWGGVSHNTNIPAGGTDFADRVNGIIDGNIEDCFRADLRRPWVVEEYKASLQKKLESMK